MYLLLLSLIYLAFISLGLPDSLLGSAWPTVYPAIGVSLSSMGLITMVISGSTICSSLLSERMVNRFGTRAVVICSVALTALALFGFSTVTEFWMFLLWAIPYGLGAGGVDAALNNYVALHYNARHMSWLHCFWGVGTIISPTIMAYALRTASWHMGYRIVAVLQLVIALILLVTARAWELYPDRPAADGEKAAPVGIRGALSIRGVAPMLLGFFCYCAAESTVMQWISSYMVQVHMTSEQTAAALASLFFLGMTVGRFLSGFIATAVGDRRMIPLGAAVALLGVALLAFGSETVRLAGLAILGLGCAPIYPAIIHATPTTFGEKNSQAIIGIQMAFAYTGSTFMPPLFGLIAQYVSMKLMPIYLCFFLGAMVILIRCAFRMTKK